MNPPSEENPQTPMAVAPGLSSHTVEELFRLLGLPLIDTAMAERIAAGAGAAAAAVHAVLEHGADGRIFDREPADYLPLLESLAAVEVEGKIAAGARANAGPGTGAARFGSVRHLTLPRSTDHDPLEADLVELALRLADGRLRSVDLVQAALERAALAKARTGCFLSIDREAALRGAELADLLLEDARRRGQPSALPLLGVPLAHKDMFARLGAVPTFGSQVRDAGPQASGTLAESVLAERHGGERPASVLQRLESAGALTLGTLNMAEFALGPTGHNAAFEDCRNAWDPAYISGGSSSGSGVAVACGAVAASLGSDSGGSVRIPAAVNGVLGLKPTYGLIPRSGSMKLSPSIDVLGPIARSARDLARLLTVLAGGDGRDALCTLRPLPNYEAALGRGVDGGRIGVARDYFNEDLDPAVRAAFERSLGLFESAGAHLVEVEVPDVQAMAELSRAVVYAEATALHATWLRHRGDRYTPQVRVRASTGLAIPAPLYLEALQLRLPLLERFTTTVFSRCDVLLTPTLPLCTPSRAETDVGAGPALWHTLSRLVRFTAPFNYLGLPALSMPAGFDARGLPIGLQLVASPFAEGRLLQFAAVHEIHHPARCSVANWPRK